MLQKKQIRIDLPNLTIYYQLKELKPLLKGVFINKVQELENNWLKLKLHTKEGSKNLILTQNGFFFSQHKLVAKQQTSGYGAFLRKRISGKKISSVRQHELERLVKININDFCLILELFAKGNVLLLDSKEKILMPFRKEEWASRKLKKGEKYSLPPALGENPLKLTENNLGGILSKSEEDLIHSLIKNIALHPIFFEEICFNSKLNKTMQAKELDKTQHKKLFKEIKELFSKKPSPVLILLKDKEILSPFTLNFCKENELQHFPSINSALDDLFAGKLLEKESFKESKKVKELEISLRKQKTALQANKERISLNKEKAEAIYSNYRQINAIISALEAYKKQKIPQKEIMYKLKNSFPILKDLDFKKQILTIELK